MSNSHTCANDINFESDGLKGLNVDKAYVPHRDMTVEVEIENSEKEYPSSRIITQGPDGNVIVQEVTDADNCRVVYDSEGNRLTLNQLGRDNEYRGEDGEDADSLNSAYECDHSDCDYYNKNNRISNRTSSLQFGYHHGEECREEEVYSDEEGGEEEEEDEEDYENDNEYGNVRKMHGDDAANDCSCSYHHQHDHRNYHSSTPHPTAQQIRHNQSISSSTLLEQQKRIVYRLITKPVMGNFLWDFEYPEDIPEMIQFWIELPYEKKREIGSLNFFDVLNLAHNDSKSNCICRLCENRTSLIEKELEKLYNGYYNVRRLIINSLTEVDLNIKFVNTILGIVEEESILQTEDEEEDEEYNELEEGENSKNASREKDYSVNGLLSVADDLVKNNGENFINLIEQLDKGVIEDERIEKTDEHINEINNHNKESLTAGTHTENEEEEDSEEIDEEEDEEEEEEEEEDESEEEEEDEEEEEEDEYDEYDSENQLISSNDREADFLLRKRLEETYKMLQICASKLLRKRLYDAFQAKRAEDISKSLLAEEEREAELKREREEKDRRKKEKAKEKKRLQKLAKEEEKQRLEKEKEEEERLLREEQLRKTEEGRKRKEAEKKKRDEELRRKQEEKKKRKEAELERQQKEKEEKNKRKQEAKKLREEELRIRREEKEKKEKERQAKKEKEKVMEEERLKENEKPLDNDVFTQNLLANNHYAEQPNGILDTSKVDIAPATEIANNQHHLGNNNHLLGQLNSLANMSSPTNKNMLPVPNTLNGLPNYFSSSPQIPTNLASPPNTQLQNMGTNFGQFDSNISSPLSMNLSTLMLNNALPGQSNRFSGNSGLLNLPNDLLNTTYENDNTVEDGLFNSVLFDSRSLNNPVNLSQRSHSIWGSEENKTGLVSEGNLKIKEPLIGHRNSIWSSNEISSSMTPNSPWNNGYENCNLDNNVNRMNSTNTNALNSNQSPPGTTTKGTALNISEIETIQLEVFTASSKLPQVAPGTYSAPLLYHYIKSSLSGSIPHLSWEGFVGALSFKTNSKLNVHFEVFKDASGEDLVKIVRNGSNMSNAAMDLNYMHAPNGLGPINGGIDVGNANNMNNLGMGMLMNMNMNMNMNTNMNMDGMNTLSASPLDMDATNDLAKFNNFNSANTLQPVNHLNRGSDLNVMNAFADSSPLNGMPVNLGDLNVNMNGLVLQDYKNPPGNGKPRENQNFTHLQAASSSLSPSWNAFGP